jgi:hypothetical protein
MDLRRFEGRGWLLKSSAPVRAIVTTDWMHRLAHRRIEASTRNDATTQNYDSNRRQHCLQLLYELEANSLWSRG